MSAEERGPPPAWLDAAFIQHILRHSGVDTNAIVKDVKIDYAIKPGDNYSSLIFRVTARLHGGAPRALLVKSLPAGERWAKLIRESHVFDKETIVLSRVLPAMKALVSEAAPERFPPFAARCLHHGGQPSPFIVLEDLALQGFRMGDRQKGLDLPHAKVALKALGRFHGTSAAIWRRRPELFDGLVSQYEDEGTKEDDRKFIVDLANTVGKWNDLPGDYDKKIYSLRDHFMEKIRIIHQRRLGKFNVLIHGDFWVNNMLFRHDENAISDIRFVDFQLSHVGNPAIDLIIFKYTSLQEDVFDDHWDSLLETYCSALSETLQILGEEAYSQKDIRNDLEEAKVFSLLVAFLWLPINRMDQGVIDTEKGAESGDWSTDMHNSPMFRHWMRKLLPMFDKQGMFDEFVNRY